MSFRKSWKQHHGVKYCKGHDDVAPVASFKTKMISGRVVFHQFCLDCRKEHEREARKRAAISASVVAPHELIAKVSEAMGRAKEMAIIAKSRKDKATERKAWIMYYGYRNKLKREQRLLEMYANGDDVNWAALRKSIPKEEPVE